MGFRLFSVGGLQPLIIIETIDCLLRVSPCGSGAHRRISELVVLQYGLGVWGLGFGPGFSGFVLGGLGVRVWEFTSDAAIVTVLFKTIQ